MVRKRWPGLWVRAIALAAFLPLAACGHTEVYRPAASEGDIGYSDMPLPDSHFLITFTGSQSMGLDEVRSMLRRRLAEVTLREGYSHFVVYETRSEAEVHSLPNPDVWTADTGFRAGYINMPRMDDDDPDAPKRAYIGNPSKSTRYTASTDILMLKGDAAAKNPDAQSAQAILDRIAGNRPPSG